MLKITLVCAAGMSTSMLMKAMDKYASANNKQMTVRAVAEGKLDSVIDETDVILIGPQIGFVEDEVKAKVKSRGIPVSVIPMTDYGTMNGEKVVNLALKLFESK